MAAMDRENVLVTEYAKLGDNVLLSFGDGTDAYDPGTGDIQIRWDGTDLDILADDAADDSVIKWGNGTKSFDQWWYGNSTALYTLWDASASEFVLQDSVSINFGTGLDVDIRWDGTDLDILGIADDQVIKFGNGTNSFDIWLYGNTATEYILWDASADDLIFQDNVSLKLGTGSDVEIRWDATDLDILAVADDLVINFGNGTNSFDIKIFGNTTSLFATWDASASELILEDSVSINFGTGLDVDIRWDGTDLDILAAADDSVIKFGTGTNSFDIWIYGNAATDYILWDASASELIFTAQAYLSGQKVKTNAQTGTTYTLLATDSGKVLTNRGAGGNIDITLPTVAAAFTGVDVTVYCVAAGTVTLTAQTAGQIVTLNDAAANSVALSTASEIIGGAFRVYCDGTSWLVMPMLWPDVGGVAQTATVAT